MRMALHRLVDAAEAGHDDDRHRQLPLLDALDQLHAVEVRHLQVGEHDAVAVLRQRVQGRLAVADGVHREVGRRLRVRCRSCSQVSLESSAIRMRLSIPTSAQYLGTLMQLTGKTPALQAERRCAGRKNGRAAGATVRGLVSAGCVQFPLGTPRAATLLLVSTLLPLPGWRSSPDRPNGQRRSGHWRSRRGRRSLTQGTAAFP